MGLRNRCRYDIVVGDSGRGSPALGFEAAPPVGEAFGYGTGLRLPVGALNQADQMCIRDSKCRGSVQRYR